jgi:hypothetical protein
MKVLLLSDLRCGDEVETPSRRRALVKGLNADRVRLQFIDDGEECELLPHLLRLVARAKPHSFPAKFFNEHAAA